MKKILKFIICMSIVFSVFLQDILIIVAKEKSITTNDNSIITFEENTESINFYIEKKESSREYEYNISYELIYIPEKYINKNISIKIETSLDKVNYNLLKDVVLTNEINKENYIVSNQKLETNKIYYKISLYVDNKLESIKTTDIQGKLRIYSNSTFNFSYHASEQTFTVPITGIYRIELWGASGNAFNNDQGVISGPGAYTAGSIHLKKGTKLYVYTGQNSTNGTKWYEASFGGGGKGGKYYFESWFASAFPAKSTNNKENDYSNAAEILSKKVKDIKTNIIDDSDIKLMLNRFGYLANNVSKYIDAADYIKNLSNLINKYRNTDMTINDIVKEIYSITGNQHFGASGGGATDVRLVGGDWNSKEGLQSRIMVASGGGGALYKMLNGTYFPGCSGTGGAAGGLVGYQGQISYIGLNANVQNPEDKEKLQAIINRYPKGGTQTVGGQKGVCLGIRTPNKTESYYDFAKSSEFYCEALNMHNGSFAYGGDAVLVNVSESKPNGIGTALASGGGGGYYGGAGSAQTITSKEEFYYFEKNPDEKLRVNLPGHTSGAGGSSYISGHTGSIALDSKGSEVSKKGCTEAGDTPDSYIGTTDKSCSIHYSGYEFTDTVMIDGLGYSWTNKREQTPSNKMPNPLSSDVNDTIEGGNKGSGAARISLLSIEENDNNEMVIEWNNIKKVIIDNPKTNKQDIFSYILLIILSITAVGFVVYNHKKVDIK